VLLPEHRGLARTRGELFGAPPPPPAPEKKAQPAPVAAAPVAPPMPYRFAGKVLKGSEQEVLVSKGDLVFPVKVGDTLDGMYRVESISAERIELVYLPLGARERIAVSSALDAERAQAPLPFPLPRPRRRPRRAPGRALALRSYAGRAPSAWRAARVSASHCA
jgi:hypothetical protein